MVNSKITFNIMLNHSVHNVTVNHTMFHGEILIFRNLAEKNVR